MADDKSTKKDDGLVEDADGDRVPPEALLAGPSPRNFAVPGNDTSGFVGVSPEYATYSHPTGKPGLTGEEAYYNTDLTDEQIAATQNLGDNAMEGEFPTLDADGVKFVEEQSARDEAAAKAAEDEAANKEAANPGPDEQRAGADEGQSLANKSDAGRASSERTPTTTTGKPAPTKSVK